MCLFVASVAKGNENSIWKGARQPISEYILDKPCTLIKVMWTYWGYDQALKDVNVEREKRLSVTSIMIWH